jgi:uncharacterized protein
LEFLILMMLPSELADLEQDLPRFELALQLLAKRLGIELTDHVADHVAVRCHRIETAERWKSGLLQIGSQFSNAVINGRQICLFKLREPLSVAGWRIDVVEVPWPGEKRYEHEGFEHVEIVLRGDPATLQTRAMALLSENVQSLSDISFAMSSPEGENQRLANPTLAVMDGRTTIKFHPWTLEEVVASEAPEAESRVAV